MPYPESDPSTWISPATAIAQLLDVSNDLSIVLGDDLFVGVMPTSPKNIVAVYDGSGGEQDPNNNLDYHKLQVIVRNESYDEGYRLCNLIQMLLQSTNPLDVRDEVFIGVWVSSNVAFMGKDKNNLSQFSSNYRVIISTQKNANRNNERMDVWIDGGAACTEFTSEL